MMSRPFARVRLTAASVCVLTAGVLLFAQRSQEGTAVLEWMSDRKLTIADFNGKAPARASEASLSAVAIQAEWSCNNGQGIWTARAVFDPARSWWHDANENIWRTAETPSLGTSRNIKDDTLLAHEQLHFDLTEVWARRIRAVLSNLSTACKMPGGAREIGDSVAGLERDWEAEQKRYDLETDHGADSARQRAWAVKAANALKAIDQSGGNAAAR